MLDVPISDVGRRPGGVPSGPPNALVPPPVQRHQPNARQEQGRRGRRSECSYAGEHRLRHLVPPPVQRYQAHARQEQGLSLIHI